MRAVVQTAGRAAAGLVVGKLLVAAAPIILVVGVILVAILGVSAAVSDEQPEINPGGATLGTCPAGQVCTGSEWDAGNIISDEVFYNTKAMSEQDIRAFIATQGSTCLGGAWCLKALRVTYPAQPADDYCAAVPAGNDVDAATALYEFSSACGINPQVMLVTLQKESQLLSRLNPTQSSYNAAWGWHCPDTGPGGTANCDPQYAGFFNQGYGMAKQWSRYRKNPEKYNYRAGQTVDIMWNVAESGCGAAPVTITNTATASLYNYTPYQPNAAALAAYPGEGDKCSAYGNRNFFRMFGSYFGSTGGGKPIQTGPPSNLVNGVTVQLPPAAGVSGEITAPNERAATAIGAALSKLGVPYAWGGGNASGPTLGIMDGCYGGCLTYQDWNITGFDCSGLMLYAYAQVGVTLSHSSGVQSTEGTQHSFNEAIPGDLLFWGGSGIHHVAMYLGTINGQAMMVEAAQSGIPVRVSPVRTGGDFNGIAVRVV